MVWILSLQKTFKRTLPKGIRIKDVKKKKRIKDVKSLPDTFYDYSGFPYNSGTC